MNEWVSVREPEDGDENIVLSWNSRCQTIVRNIKDLIGSITFFKNMFYTQKHFLPIKILSGNNVLALLFFSYAEEEKRKNKQYPTK